MRTRIFLGTNATISDLIASYSLQQQSTWNPWMSKYSKIKYKKFVYCKYTENINRRQPADIKCANSIPLISTLRDIKMISSITLNSNNL